MNKNRLNLLSWHIALVTFLVGLGACQTRPKSVKVAVALPLTGDIASLGQGLKRAVTMAIDEFNAAKTPYMKDSNGEMSMLVSPPVEILAFDDRSDPKEAVSVANRIVSDPSVIAVIGHFNSGCSIPASRVYAQAGLPMISPASSNPELTNQQLSPQWTWSKNIFRMNTTDNVQGSYGADFVRMGLRAKKVAVIHDKTAYGQGVAEEFKKRFEADGGTVTAFEGLQTGDRDFRSLLTRVKSTSPDALYFGGMFSEGGILVRQARDIGFAGPFVACEANYDPAFIRVAGEAANGAYVTFLGSPPELTPTAKDFLERYKKRYPEEEVKSYDHYGYEVASLVLKALTQVGPDRGKIMAYLRTVEFNGVLGTTKFDEKGDTMNKTITLFKVKNGSFQPSPWAPSNSN